MASSFSTEKTRPEADPMQILTQMNVFWGHAPRPPGLASLEAMGGVIFVEASQSHGGAGGWPSANPNPDECFLGAEGNAGTTLDKLPPEILT
ncbi:hypothetical protein TRICI_001528 [Trichomonascus ciferrii]|uniref:Uncharacterized protein n=1 Tax=Trichomonascus ciferrii TaxID=44093 RepID=A0A642V9F3_9ASCO|nr:hypothetical protein TRICI_001528 [Trichomonascus ciferrii]